MKRIGPYVLAAVLGGAAVYWFLPRAETDDVLKEKLTTCETSLGAETRVNKGLADELVEVERACQAKCDARVDQILAERTR
jgi:hypothetical protein